MKLQFTTLSRLVKLHKSFEVAVNNESWLTLAKKLTEDDLKLQMDFEYFNFHMNQKKWMLVKESLIKTDV